MSKATGSTFGELSGEPVDRQRARGYLDTLREIRQQPETWRNTAERLRSEAGRLEGAVRASGVLHGDASASVVLTGSGSSHYVGACAAPGLQEAWGRSVRAVPSGDLLTHADGVLIRGAPCLAVSFGRSGDSPESGAVVDSLRSRDVTQLLVTCNAEGGLATRYRHAQDVTTLLLDPRTHDRSLVMTSSVTNMVLAARGLAPMLSGSDTPDAATWSAVAAAGARLLSSDADRLAPVASAPRRKVLYLGSGVLFGAALEAALKMLEMTAGRVWTLAESFLGLRHGPMSAVDDDTLVIAFLSSDPTRRAYEADLLDELRRKRLGATRVVVGRDVPPELVSGEDDLAVSWPGAGGAPGTTTGGDPEECLLHIVAGQVLAFWRCLAEGLRPDAPSPTDVITRVVPPFRVHGGGAGRA